MSDTVSRSLLVSLLGWLVGALVALTVWLMLSRDDNSHCPTPKVVTEVTR